MPRPHPLRYRQYDSLQDMLKYGFGGQVGAAFGGRSVWRAQRGWAQRGWAQRGWAQRWCIYAVPPCTCAQLAVRCIRCSMCCRPANRHYIVPPNAAAPLPPRLPQTSTLYYEPIDLPLPEYENLMAFKV